VCRGVLRAAQELGIGNDWLDSLRSDSQRKMLDDARRLEYFSGLISTEAPKPPKAFSQAARRSQRQANLRPVLVPATGPPQLVNEASHTGRKRTKTKR
jgi:hypothetical protein